MRDKKISDLVYLKSMIDAIDRIALHQRSPHPSYTIDRAVVYELVTIGEAASRITPTLRGQHPEVEWGVIVAARNRMVHGYLEVDYDRVRNIKEESK